MIATGAVVVELFLSSHITDPSLEWLFYSSSVLVLTKLLNFLQQKCMFSTAKMEERNGPLAVSGWNRRLASSNHQVNKQGRLRLSLQCFHLWVAGRTTISCGLRARPVRQRALTLGTLAPLVGPFLPHLIALFGEHHSPALQARHVGMSSSALLTVRSCLETAQAALVF